MTPVARSERGFLSFSAILGLVVFAVLVFLALRLVPPYITNYQLQDSLENLARTVTYSPVGESDIRKEIIKQARELGVPLKDQQVVVQKAGGSVAIAVRYEVPVDLWARQVVLKFEPSAGNRNIMSR